MYVLSRNRAKLSFEQVIELRQSRHIMTTSQLSRKYGITFKATQKILDGISYKYLPLNPDPIQGCVKGIPKLTERFCYGCQTYKEINEENFYRRTKSGFQAKCKPCFKIYFRNYSRKMKEQRLKESA